MKCIAFDVHDYEKESLNNIGNELKMEVFMVQESLTQDNLSLTEGYDGISVLGYSRITKDMLAQMKEMGIFYLSTRTIGFDHIDIQAANEYGIQVSNSRYDAYNVADFTVMMLLMLLRKAKVSVCRSLVNDFSLNGMMGREVRSLTIGVIGTGRIGATVISNLSGFGCRILAYDAYENPSVKGICDYVDLDMIYKEADVISLHIPMTDENYHLINKESIQKMKDGVILINTARGGLIDSQDLIEGLEKGKIGGAGIDTIEEEEGIMHVHVGTNIVEKRSLMYIKQFPNVVYTQHYAFFTEEACRSMVRCGLESLNYGFLKQENPYQIMCK